MATSNLSVLIVSPDLAGRVKLREVLRTQFFKGKFEYASSTREALERFSEKNLYDFCFLAMPLGKEGIQSLLTSAAGISEWKAPRFIITLNTTTRLKPDEVAGLYLAGAAGFIAEPFSTDELIGLLDVLRIPNTLNDPKQRKLRAMQFMLGATIGHVDTIAEQQALGKSIKGPSLKYLRAISKDLETFVTEDKEAFGQAMIGAFENAKVPHGFPTVKRSAKVVQAAAHPGVLIKQLMIKRGLSAERLQAAVRLDPAVIAEILDEKKSLDEHSSREFARALGKTATEWMRLQKAYDAWMLSQKPKSE